MKKVKRVVYTIVTATAGLGWLLLLGGCASTSFEQTVRDNKPIIDSLAENSAIACWMYAPQSRAYLMAVCAVNGAIDEDTDPVVAQEAIKKALERLWVNVGTQDAWLIQTMLNDLVRFAGLNTPEPTKEKLEFWLSIMTEFCGGVQMMDKPESACFLTDCVFG